MAEDNSTDFDDYDDYGGYEEQEPVEKQEKSKSKKSSKKKSVKIEFDPNDKEKALETAITHIEKTFGKGSIMKLGASADSSKGMEATPTGSLGLDIALGIGGIPKGRVIEIYGPESSGKTTLTLHMIAELQKRGGIAAFIDAEHAMDPVYAKKLGVDIDNLYISQPDDGEQALEIVETMARSSAIDLIVVDSVAALVPRSEIEGYMGESHMGLHARLMSQALRKLTGFISKSKCTVIFINQLREKIGSTYGGAETTTGGRALKFYSSIRIDIRKALAGAIKDGNDIVGHKTIVKIAKNKVAPPFKIVDFDIMFGEGISKIGEILDMAAESDIVNKSGAWYSYKETRLGQGREKAKNFLKENPDIRDEIEDAVRVHYGIPPENTKAADEKADGKSAKKPEDDSGKTSKKDSAKTKNDTKNENKNKAGNETGSEADNDADNKPKKDSEDETKDDFEIIDEIKSDDDVF